MHEAYILILWRNYAFTLWIPVRMNDFTNVTHKLLFKA